MTVEKKDLRLQKNLDPALPLALFDADRVTQVLYNLITNALKFTEKGSITIGSRQDDGRILVWVEDTGLGIPKEDIHKIFERFEQIRQDGQLFDGGTGLGLAICKQIVEQLGGKIWVESEYGKGSKFSFTLSIGGAT
jgi:signal transduction histidine kinase